LRRRVTSPRTEPCARACGPPIGAQFLNQLEMPMKSEQTVNRFKRSRSTGLVSAVAICVMLASVAYGIVDGAAHFVKAPPPVPASVTHPGPIANSEPQPAAWIALSATSEFPRIVTSGDSIEGPRECVLDKGITDACAFN
jgi:hypothetical protein